MNSTDIHHRHFRQLFMFVLHSILCPEILSILIPEHELQLFRMSLEIVIDMSTVETVSVPLDVVVHQFILRIKLV